VNQIHIPEYDANKFFHFATNNQRVAFNRCSLEIEFSWSEGHLLGVWRRFAYILSCVQRNRRWPMPSIQLQRRGFNAPPDIDSQSKVQYGQRTQTVMRYLLTLRVVEEFQLSERRRARNTSLWRSHHIKMVRRMVGAKRGTGAQKAIGYLSSTRQKVLPEL
jgi:hypothetical protein